METKLITISLSDKYNQCEIASIHKFSAANTNSAVIEAIDEGKKRIYDAVISRFANKAMISELAGGNISAPKLSKHLTELFAQSQGVAPDVALSYDSDWLELTIIPSTVIAVAKTDKQAILDYLTSDSDTALCLLDSTDDSFEIVRKERMDSQLVFY